MEEANTNKLNEYVYGKNSENRTSDKKLYDPKWFPLFSFLTSFWGAAILYSINHGRMGYARKRNLGLVISSVIFAIWFIIPIVTHLGRLTFFITYIINLIVGSILKGKQSKMFKEHISSGGKRASFLIAFVLYSFFMIAVFMLLVYTGILKI